jgi:ribosomal protein L12E/L44/L45/RPP1/RPP2
MSGSDDLKDLLDRLKGEVGPLPEPAPRPAAPAPERAFRENRFQREEKPQREDRYQPRGEEEPRQSAARRDFVPRPHRPEAQRDLPAIQSPASLAWSENKETTLFGMLTGLIAALGGVLAGLDYLVLIGGVVFMLFSFMLLLSLFGYYLNFRRRAPDSHGLAERVDALSKKVEMLSSMAASGGARAYQAASPEKERELEHKVEELRVLVKTLSRAVEQQNR